MKDPVLTKADFVARYAAGEFGNASPTWDAWQEWFDARAWRRYGRLFHVRNRVAGGKTWYNVPWTKMRLAWVEAATEVGEQNLYISAMAPTERTSFQGEVQRGLWLYDLTCTTVRKPMRDALAERAEYADGLRAALLLRRYLCPRSHDWLMHLLDEYPDHVVEFSCYEVEWGTVPGYNTVFWEVRKY